MIFKNKPLGDEYYKTKFALHPTLVYDYKTKSKVRIWLRTYKAFVFWDEDSLRYRCPVFSDNYYINMEYKNVK